MLQILQFIAAFCTALFAGAAVYINVAEHPARACVGDARFALTQWAASYKRATLMQVPLALAGLVTSVAAWLLGASAWWLVAGILIGSVVPFTLIGIMPTNRKLLASDRDAASAETRALLDRWGKLHAVRSVLSLLATALLLWQLVRSTDGV
jgi:Anthrone oxygenase